MGQNAHPAARNFVHWLPRYASGSYHLPLHHSITTAVSVAVPVREIMDTAPIIPGDRTLHNHRCWKLKPYTNGQWHICFETNLHHGLQQVPHIRHQLMMRWKVVSYSYYLVLHTVLGNKQRFLKFHHLLLQCFHCIWNKYILCNKYSLIKVYSAQEQHWVRSNYIKVSKAIPVTRLGGLQGWDVKDLTLSRQSAYS
jgi:hypothetical protein